MALTNAFNAPRLITLTLKATDASLKETVARLFNRFGFLRTMKGWSSRVTGGVWTLEVTRNATTGQWHPHLHCICDGEFFPQPLLKELWHEATGDSFIVDVRAVHDRKEAAKYIAAYLAKPADVACWPASAIQEYALALHGRRLMQPFGTARSVDLDDDEAEAPIEKTTILCTAHTLQAACSAQYQPALHAREILSRMGHDHAIACGVTPPTRSGTAAPVEDWEKDQAFATLVRLHFHWPKLPDDPAAADDGGDAKKAAAANRGSPLPFEGVGSIPSD